MRDFGNLNAPCTTCSVCGSRNHGTADHQRLNNAAPDMLDWIKTLENDDGRIPEWLWKQRAELIAKAEGA